jgi:acyl-CoA reductase-like NAD-dependent aldehyde dehydrogenase
MSETLIHHAAPAERTAPPTYTSFIDGRWWPAGDGALFEDREPFTGDVYAHVADCGRPEAQRAVAAAAAAFDTWDSMAPAEKAAIFYRAADIVKRRQGEIADILARETGAATLFAGFQQNLVVQALQQAAGWLYLAKGEVLPSDFTGTFTVAIRRPVGVVASFTPWNGASILGWRAVLSPLAAGNTVVVKPSELAPISAGLIMAEVLEEAGLPKGVVNVVTHAPGKAAAIADEFFENPEVRCINFIGSVQTARILAARAGQALKRSVMELGGYNPLIVLDDADVDYAVRLASFSSFFHQGQICMNARKILIDRSIYEEFLEKFAAATQALPTGDPLAPGTIVGPLITPEALAKVNDRVREAVAKGARIVTGGHFENQVYEPTILVDVPDDALVSCEETFGPVVVVQAVDSAEEAVAVANRVMYGLVGSIVTGDRYRGFEIARKIKSGVIGVNIPTVNDELQFPGGGVRESGWGRTGPHSLEDFTDLVCIGVESGQRALPTD